MGVATTEASLSVIQERLDQLNVMLGRIAARQDQMLVDLKKRTATLTPIATTTTTFVLGQVPEHPTTKPSPPSLFSAIQFVGTGVAHADAIFATAMPTRCSTLGLDINDGSNQAEVAIRSLVNTEAVLLSPPELSLDKPLQSCINLKFNTTLGSCQTISDVDHASMVFTTGVISAVVIDPSETLPIPPLQAFAVLDPEKQTHTMCSTKCLDDDTSRAMSMFSRGVTCTTNVSCVFTNPNPTTLPPPVVPVCDDSEDLAASGFEEVLQHDDVKWKPWPPDLQVWVSYKKPICRPHPWPSYAYNHREDVHMTFARLLPRRRPYLKLPMLKCLYTEGRHLLDIWWSPARHMEQWPLHDIVLGAITVCSYIPGILGHVIKQMIARMSKCQGLIQITNKPSSLLVLTLPRISFFHVERLLANRLSWYLDPGGSRYAGWVLNNKNLAGTIKVSFMNLLLDVDVWEDSKSRILATELCFQWDPGIMLNALMDAMSGKLSSSIHFSQQSVYLHWPYLQALSKLGKCILMYVSTISICLEIRLASHLLYRQWYPSACCPLQVVAKYLQYMWALIGNVEVVLDSTRLRPTDMEMESFSIQAGHSSIVLCHQLKISLKFGMTEVLEDVIDRLVVSLYCTFVRSRLFICSTSSLEENAELGILLIRNNSQDYAYEFYFSQQSKLHLNYAKSEFLMWPSKDCLLMPWDPGDVQNKALRATSIKSI